MFGMRKKGYLKHLDFEFIEILSLILAFIFGLFIRQIQDRFYSDSYINLLVFEIIINITITFFYSPFKDILKRSRLGLISYFFFYDGLQVLFVTMMLFIIKGSEAISRLFIAYEYAIYFVLSTVLKFLWRRYLTSSASKAINNGSNTLLIVTSKSHIKKVIKQVKTKNFENNRILGLCVLDDELKNNEYDGIKVVCNKDELLAYACNNWVDQVLFEVSYNKIPKDIIDSLTLAGITTNIELNDLISTGSNTKVNKLLGDNVLSISIKERSNKQIVLKGLMDILGGIVGSLITVILTIIIGPIIKIKSPGGPIFYKQERIGLNGRHFYMYKFRSMNPDAEAHLDEVKKNNRVSSDLMFKMENDPRIIPGIGNFIRKTSLDEFPQFFNVLKGDMSLVGTRPPTVDEWNKYELRHRIRMSTKPGITGMWQVSGRNNITDFDEVVKLDAKYINEWTLGLDIKIILLTVKKILIRDKDEAM